MPRTEKMTTQPGVRHRGRSGAAPSSDDDIARENARMRQELKEKADALRDRLLFLLEFEWAPEKYKYRYLESRTGIPEASWQNFFLGRQQATLEMLIAVCHHMPHRASWLMTGILGRDSLGNEDPKKENFEKYLTHREWIRGQKETK